MLLQMHSQRIQTKKTAIGTFSFIVELDEIFSNLFLEDLNKLVSIFKILKIANSQLIANLRCGPGEIRTLVQTRNKNAFYMFKVNLVFDLFQAFT